MNKALTAIALIGSAFLLWFLFAGGIGKSVANDMVAQYNMAKRSGSPVDVCVHAGMAAAAYLQAKNEDRYVEWKNIERLDCSRAGISR